MVRRHVATTVGAALLLAAGAVRAQHCAPLYDCYLSQSWVQKLPAEPESADRLRIRAQFAKEGGAGDKPAYQGYLVAYLDRNADRVPAAAPADLLDPKAAVVLHTQLMRRNEKEGVPGPWTYDLEFTIRGEDLVDRLIAHAGLGAEDREDRGHWHHYVDRIRFAVFVPWLADAKYSVLGGLPDDRHECNYEHARALLFQELPFRVQFSVSRSTDPRAFVWIRVRSERAGPDAPQAK
ncbi:MAG: hypothetical protein KF830_00480 [Planctomycetes bacterium]|nr:hypothetical protein [Planctomycetota bacterium]